MQVDFDDYMLATRRSARRGERARRAAGTALPVPPRAARAGVTVATGAASARRRPTARRSCDAAREAFGELGYEARRRARHRPPHRASPPARSTTTSPTRTRSSARWSRRRGAEARRRVRAARAGARRPATSSSRRGYRAYFAFIVEDPARFAFLRRNLRARHRRARSRPARRDLAADLAARWRAARAGVDLDYSRTRWSPSGSSSAPRMAEREPPDAEGATRFATALFLAGSAA